MASRTQINASADHDQVRQIETLRAHFKRRDLARTGTSTSTSRAGALMRAASLAHELLIEQVVADERAWTRLVDQFGETAVLTLLGHGEGEPEPERVETGTTPDGRPAQFHTPARWRSLRVEATVDGQPIGMPLFVTNTSGSELSVIVSLTDEAGAAQLYLGPLSLVVEDHPAYYDNRLFRIAKDLGFA